MSTPTPEDCCFCGSCDGTQTWHNNKVAALLANWQNAMKQARNGFDESENNRHAIELADQIGAEIERCSSAIKQECSKYGLYSGEPINVGQRDLSQ